MVEEREVTPILKVEGLTKVFDQKAGKKERVLRRWTMFHFLYSRGKH